MAVGVNSKHPLQARFQALREKYPQYHVVISCCEGSFEFLPGARWVYHESEAKAGGNFIMNFTKGAPRYEYHIIVEGTFKYTRKNMTQNNYTSYLISTGDFDWENGHCVFRAKPKFSASSWMSCLDDKLNLKDLTLPGTRCSSASVSWINDGADLDITPELEDTKLKKRIIDMHKCHHDTIPAQLKNGIRLLDLRCDGGYALRDGPLSLNKQLDDVLDQVNTFLEANPRETVLVLLGYSSASVEYNSEEPWPECYSIKNDTLSEHFDRLMKKSLKIDDNIYTDTKWPELKDVRGKSVILRGWDVDPDQEEWGLRYRCPIWEAAHDSQSVTKASELAAQRWDEIVGDFSSQDVIKSIFLAASLRHDPENEKSWIFPNQTAPILQTKATDHIGNYGKQLKRLWILGDYMEEKTNMAIAKLNYLGVDDKPSNLPPPEKTKTI